MNTNTHTRTVKIRICRPSRFQQRHARYDLTLNGRLVIEAIHAVQQAEADADRMAQDVQTGSAYSTTAFDTINARHTAAVRKQAQARDIAASGKSIAANRV